MAGITYAQVAEACDRIAEQGQNPSIRMVRRELGNTGSETTILKHLNEWRKSASTGDFVSVDLPPDFSAAVNKLVEQRIGEYRISKEQEIKLLRDDNAELTRLAEEREEEMIEKDTEIRLLRAKIETKEEDIIAAKAETNALRDVGGVLREEFARLEECLIAKVEKLITPPVEIDTTTDDDTPGFVINPEPEPPVASEIVPEDTAEAETIAYILQLNADGESTRQIAEHLNAEKRNTLSSAKSGTWNHTMIARLIKKYKPESESQG